MANSPQQSSAINWNQQGQRVKVFMPVKVLPNFASFHQKKIHVPWTSRRNAVQSSQKCVCKTLRCSENEQTILARTTEPNENKLHQIIPPSSKLVCHNLGWIDSCSCRLEIGFATCFHLDKSEQWEPSSCQLLTQQASTFLQTIGDHVSYRVSCIRCMHMRMIQQKAVSALLYRGNSAKRI